MDVRYDVQDCMRHHMKASTSSSTIVVHVREALLLVRFNVICTVRTLDQDPHFHPDLESTFQDLSVGILFASIGEELRK